MGLAARGARRLGEEVERIGDREELSQVRRQAGVVQVRATIAGAVMTVLSLLI